MGPVAQRVFKTRAVVQPTARSVRLRRRSATRASAADGSPRSRLPRTAPPPTVIGSCHGRQPSFCTVPARSRMPRNNAGDRQRDEEVPHAHTPNVAPSAVGLPSLVQGTRLPVGGHVDRDHAGGAPRALRRAPRARAGGGPLGRRPLRPVLRPLLRRLRVRADRAADRVRPRRRRHARARGPATRGRARRGESTLDRVEHYLEYPGDPRAEDVLATDARRPGALGDDRRRPGRLPVDPRLPRADALGALGRKGRPRRRADRGADGGQVGGRDRAHPRERALGKPRSPSPPALHARRRDGDRGGAARERRGDVRDARRDRRDLPRAELRLRAARTPATAGRSAATPRSRTRSPGTSCSRPATSS